jgi:hypothetical protein
VVLGAGAEVGPLPVLLNWGVRVIGVDLPRPVIWERVLETARRSGGTLIVSVAHDKPGEDALEPEGSADLAQRAGLDLTGDVPAVADWLAALDGPLVLGNYVYADGAANVRVSSAVDALTVRLLAERRDVALAFLATPTDVFAVPADAVAQAVRAYAARSRAAKLGEWPLRTLSGGRLLRCAYPPGADPGICEGLVPQQGPNYALAKRLQRWRATVARDGGTTVSLNVAPPTRTRSVMKNRVLAAAYAGAHRFGVEVFEPATTKTLMAALLVHDLHTSGGGPAQAHPWQDEARAAAHGGLWRIAYAPRSALGIAALLGYRAARNGRQDSGPVARSLPDQRQPGVGVLRAPGGDQHPGEVIGRAGAMSFAAGRSLTCRTRTTAGWGMKEADHEQGIHRHPAAESGEGRLDLPDLAGVGGVLRHQGPGQGAGDHRRPSVPELVHGARRRYPQAPGQGRHPQGHRQGSRRQRDGPPAGAHRRPRPARLAAGAPRG